MKKLEKFLFFYSILAITIVMIFLGVFQPKPLNLAVAATLIPIVFYFWLRLTSPETTSAGMWSFRFILSVIIICALAIYGLYLSKNITPPDPTLNNKLSEEINLNNSLKETIASLSAQLTKNGTIIPKTSTVSGVSVTDLINPSSDTIPSQQITGRAGIKFINVYENPISASKKIATVSASINYFYTDKQFGWYKIELSDTSTGWVNGNQVQEVQ